MISDITIVSYCHLAHRHWIPHWVEQVNKQTIRGFSTIFICHNWKPEECDHKEFQKLHPEIYQRFVCYNFDSQPVIGEVIDLGASLVDTQWMAHHDLDDIVHPRRLELQSRFLQDNSDVSFLGTRMVGFNGEPAPEMLDLNYVQPNEPNLHVQTNDEIRDCLINRGQNCLGHTTMIYRPEALKAIGGFSRSDVKLDGKSPDFETWKKAIMAGYKFHRLPQLCALWRLDSSSMRHI